MRRKVKQDILALIDTLSEAHEEYRQLNNAGSQKTGTTAGSPKPEVPEMGSDTARDSVFAVLSSCQESAISIGEAIEKSEGEGTASVGLLEKYCEDLYQAGQAGTAGYAAVLDKDLKEIRESVIGEIPVQLEVVFFPYKAQMWDSMESIYLAFRKRKDVNTYLVPIPYYNRRNDGSIEAMHCESDRFPKDEPVTDWRAYDIEKIQPDIIFIHNPYDDANLVTSVAPGYYSWELKKHTDCLVYCPYYATVGGMGKGQALCKSYRYVDYIIAQSQFQAGFYDPSIPKEKFLIAGSPKFDRVIGLTKEREEEPERFYSRVPSDWRKKCEGRRVYFYNTSLSGLLADTPAFLQKMEYVFRTFAKRKDAVLFWRPHPLFDSTFTAMRPQYYEWYLEMKQEFLDSGTGILDETPDISTAVALCDAFIGDGGTSVTSLYGVTGKPLFLMNNNIMHEPEDSDVNDELFTGVPIDPRQDGYYVTGGNQLYRCQSPLGDSVDFSYVGKVSEYSSQMYGSCFKYGHNLYVTPYCLENFLVIHQDGSVTETELRHCTDQGGKFFGAVMASHYIFLIPNEYSYIVRIDLESGEIRYSDDLRDIFVIENSNLVRRFGGAAVFNNRLVLGSPHSSLLLMMDVDSMEYDIVRTGEEDGSGSVVIYNPETVDDMNARAESLWILPYRGMKVKHFYPYTGELKEYDLSCQGFACSDPDQVMEDADVLPFSSAVIKDGYLYLAPSRGNRFLVLDTSTGESHEWKFPLSIEWQGADRFFTGGYRGILFRDSVSGRYYWMSGTARKLYEVGIEPDQCRIIKEIPVRFPIDEARQNTYGFSDGAPWSRYGLSESAINPLSQFISGKVNGAQFSRDKQLASFGEVAVNLDGTCGEHVCEYLYTQMTQFD